MDGGRETTTLQFSCACHKVNGSAEVPTSKLPLPFDFCHCTICRHQTGLLCASYLTLPEDCLSVNFRGPLVNYKSSDSVTRSFCNHCGANVYFQDSNESKPDICTGVLTDTKGIIKLRSHIYVPDTLDGGLSAWLPEIPAWTKYSSQSKQLEIGQLCKSKLDSQESSTLNARCQCKGIQFLITRPNQHSGGFRAPHPDLIVPYDAGNTTIGKESHEWWLCASGKKYLAGTCVCQSCRLTSGFDVQMWAFIPKINTLQLNAEPFDFTMGTLKAYESSNGIHRHFCNTCGATAFWQSVERPDLIDVSVGLLDADEGARAESWLDWRTDRVSFEEQGQNKDLTTKLKAGLELWGKTRS